MACFFVVAQRKERHVLRKQLLAGRRGGAEPATYDWNRRAYEYFNVGQDSHRPGGYRQLGREQLSVGFTVSWATLAAMAAAIN
jgi:hypothetical protein